MRTVIIVQKATGLHMDVYGVFSTWKATSEHFSRCIQSISVEDLKHWAKTYQSYKIGEDRFYFREMTVSKSHK